MKNEKDGFVNFVFEFSLFFFFFRVKDIDIVHLCLFISLNLAIWYNIYFDIPSFSI